MTERADDPGAREALEQRFDQVLDLVAGHASYAQNLTRALEHQEQLVLNYHTHGPDQGYCASICKLGVGIEAIGMAPPIEELAHIRGVGTAEEQCAPFMQIFAERILARYGFEKSPLVYLNGEPFAG